MYALPSSAHFWKALNIRFSQDEKYQFQTLFLPDLNREYGLLIIGDSLFQNSIPRNIANQQNVKRIIVNSYDADDLRSFARALRSVVQHSESKVCNLLLQVSPIFSLRSKALRGELDSDLIEDVLKRRNPGDHVSTFFDVVQEWARTEVSLPNLESDPMRPPRMVGQAKFADPNRENWERAFSAFSTFEGKIVAVLDTCGTDWSADGNLISATKDNLTALATEDAKFSWTTLHGLASLQMPGC